MPFNDFEIADGRPTELYEFNVAGTFTRYTSASVEQTVGANTYAVLPIGRTDPSISKDNRSGELTLSVPSDIDLVLDFRTVIPYTLPSLTIFRVHQQELASIFTFWKGFVSSVAIRDRRAEIACQPVDRIFNRQIPRFVYSGICNHVLYDNGCRLLPADFDHSGTVSSIDPDNVSMVISGLSAQAAILGPGLTSAEQDIFWQGGYVETTGGAERRMILQGNVDSDPNKIRILLPFRNLSAGGTVTVYAGCDHSLDTCDRKFSNVSRFGGFPFVPTINPFTIELDGGV